MNIDKRNLKTEINLASGKLPDAEACGMSGIDVFESSIQRGRYYRRILGARVCFWASLAIIFGGLAPMMLGPQGEAISFERFVMLLDGLVFLSIGGVFFLRSSGEIAPAVLARRLEVATSGGGEKKPGVRQILNAIDISFLILAFGDPIKKARKARRI